MRGMDLVRGIGCGDGSGSGDGSGVWDALLLVLVPKSI